MKVFKSRFNISLVDAFIRISIVVTVACSINGEVPDISQTETSKQNVSLQKDRGNSVLTDDSFYNLAKLYRDKEVEVVGSDEIDHDEELLQIDWLDNIIYCVNCEGLYSQVKVSHIIDNDFNLDGDQDKNSVGYHEFGEWSHSKFSGHNGTISRYSYDEDALAAYIAKVKYEHYKLSIYQISNYNAVTELIVEISQEGEIVDTIIVNLRSQQQQSNWFELGNYTFDPGKLVVVTAKGTSDDEGVVRVDAVKFERI